MRLFFLAMSICCLQQVSDQQADSMQKLLDRILPAFTYKQELKNCVFMAGGDFISGQRIGGDSITLGVPVKKSVKPFLISKFEVRNKDYKKFVDYVRDSI